MYSIIAKSNTVYHRISAPTNFPGNAQCTQSTIIHAFVDAVQRDTRALSVELEADCLLFNARKEKTEDVGIR